MGKHKVVLTEENMVKPEMEPGFVGLN